MSSIYGSDPFKQVPQRVTVTCARYQDEPETLFHKSHALAEDYYTKQEDPLSASLALSEAGGTLEAADRPDLAKTLYHESQTYLNQAKPFIPEWAFLGQLKALKIAEESV
jgi:hypothetical protein